MSRYTVLWVDQDKTTVSNHLSYVVSACHSDMFRCCRTVETEIAILIPIGTIRFYCTADCEEGTRTEKQRRFTNCLDSRLYFELTFFYKQEKFRDKMMIFLFSKKVSKILWMRKWPFCLKILSTMQHGIVSVYRLQQGFCRCWDHESAEFR